MKITAIILAAGSGSRMNSRIKKQYIEIKGYPVLWYTISAFQKSDVDEIILVTGNDEIEYCEQLVQKYGFTKVIKVVAGGKERYDSVRNGLDVSNNTDYVLIHDGARPLIKVATINECIQKVKECDACVVAVQVKDTIKKVDAEGKVVETPDRNMLWSVQTPQAFKFSLIKNAYKKMMLGNNRNITDDSMIVELFTDKKVSVVQGEYTNIKITTKEDLVSAEKFLSEPEI